MKRKYCSRYKVLTKLLIEGLFNEFPLLFICSLAIIYAFVSNFLLSFPPLNISETTLHVLSSIDVVLRNCCYGIVAGVIFYFINDFFKNIVKNIDSYNEMYPDVYNLWLKSHQLVLALSGYKYNESHDQETVMGLMTSYFYGKKKLHRSYSKISIDLDRFHLLVILWTEANKDKNKFLDAYGPIISRSEYSKLNDKELDTSLERITAIMPNVDYFEKGMTVEVWDNDIQRVLFLILNYKSCLVNMVNKYSKYYYADERGIRKDAF